MAPPLNFERTTRLVARSLGVPPQELLDSFRAADPSDLDEILALRETVFGHATSWDDRRYMQWRYALLPGSRSFATFRVLRVGGKLVAGIGAEEFSLDTPAGQIKAACAMDILALAHFRDAGIGAWLNLALFRHYPVVLALGSNVNSKGMVQTLYAPMEPRSEMQFPLDARDFVRKRVRIPVIGAITGSAATALLRLRCRWYQFRSRHVEGSLREIKRFESTHSLVRHSRWHGDEIAVVRTPAYLNWRYFDNPRAGYRVFGWFERDVLCGYVVFGVERDDADSAPLWIVDWWVADDDNPGPFRALVAAIAELALKNGSPVVRALASGKKLHSLLRNSGFTRHIPSRMAAGWHGHGPQLTALPTDSIDWCFTSLADDMDDENLRFGD